jgi:hypothetical protein
VSDRKELSVLLLPSSLCMSVCNVLSSFTSAAVWMFNRARARNLLQSLAAANGSILSFSFRLRQSSEICWLSFYQKNVRSSTHVPPPPGKKIKWDKATMELERPSVCPIRPVCPPAFPLPPPAPSRLSSIHNVIRQLREEEEKEDLEGIQFAYTRREAAAAVLTRVATCHILLLDQVFYTPERAIRGWLRSNVDSMWQQCNFLTSNLGDAM